MAGALAAVDNGTPLKQPGMAGAEAVRIGAAIDKDKPYDDRLSHIAGRLSRLAQEQVALKEPVERRWIAAARAYHGIYDRAFLAALTEAKQSTAFVKATRAKTVALEARLFDLMFPTDDRNWEASPTPVPKLSGEVKEAELRATNAAQQATQAEGDGNPALAQQIAAEGNDEAARASAASDEIAKVTQASKLMQDEMDDQLVESRWPAECRDAIHTLCLYGPGIIKGPMVNEKSRGKWMPSQVDGAQAHEYELKQTEDIRPMVRFVDPWSFFPDMSARRIGECEFTFERYLWTKSDLRKMVQTHGFNPDAVRELLREDRSKRPSTEPSLNNLITLRSLTEEATGQITGRYIGWEYHGELTCEEVCTILTAMGQEDAANAYAAADDPLQEHRVIVHFCNDTILKIAPEWPLDSGESLYSMANLEDAEGQLFGYGVPSIMCDSQDALNSSWRVALDNSALSVGPQAIIAKDEVAPADGSWTFTAKKIWWRVKAAIAHAPQSIEFFNVPNNMEEIATIIDLATRFIDMETGIAQPQTGEEAKSTPTVGGMAILQSAANIIFRRIVKNVDDGIIAPTMRRLYDWNMQFSKKPEIKGDMQVDARGASVLLVKEVQAQNLGMIVNQLMANPNIAPMIKAYPTIEKLFQAMMIKPSECMVSLDDYESYLKDQASQPPPKSPQEIMAEARIQAATIAADASKLSDETTKLIAQLRERTAMIELAAQGEISMNELQAMLTGKKMDIDHKERAMVAEAAIDRQDAREARDHGEVPGGSGGSFNAGPAKKTA